MSPDRSTASPSPGFDPGLAEALRAFAARSPILIGLDFDGVLAPFVTDPRAARPLPASVSALDRLARHPAVRVGYISGRPLQDLRSRAQAPPSALFVGSHGAEIDLGSDPAEGPALDDAQARTLAALTEALEGLVRDCGGGRLEAKPGGVVLHTRGEDDATAELLVRGVREVAGRFAGVKFSTGHSVAEFAIWHADKGQGVSALREHTRAEAVLFAGDDTTDEDAFAVLGAGDLGVKVGPGATLARFRVGSPAEVAGLLAHLADLLDV